ncbi:Translation initiation factor 3 subunit b [Coemansia spiralis]|uniref:Eukaryotic translation initiation factor 3 subunit B n=2 Tax=Coemansia TaxID=4863 RepID=A0A9W8L0I5_9FUNG|nr:eukaryotic translation initiation factor eIF2A-domain-containing protein [Coemansia spiralis]KAJ1993807.1 Translation initiation factor 3 subunit b [Coemansia umbellata]KAJ2623183.1 Translation initiation factor 3 subunit b [Coemansia sp. RSA 1358]KAJ2680060.1 Translation initiation factor 3 subunit b [Coemansia spiralis]
MSTLTIDNLPASEAEIDFSDLEAKFVIPEQEETLENVVVVDNLPIVEPSKEETLIKVLKKTFSKYGKVKENGIHMPKENLGNTTKSKGYAFIELESAKQAQAAIRNLNGFGLSKAHILLVSPFMDVEKYTEVEDNCQLPPAEPFAEREHLKSWLTDDFGRDQFTVFAGNKLNVYWNEATQSAEEIVSRSNWTEAYVQWSPLGSYMCTFHPKGLVLWGGPSWNKLMRFIHLGVRLADFSPSERYLVTMSQEPISLERVNQQLGPNELHQNPFTNDDEGNTICIWDVRTGTLLRSFAPPKNQDGSVAKVGWPQFKWSPSENYFARMTPGSSLAIYEAPSMVLLDKKSMKVPGIQDFAWCPRTITDPRTGAVKPEMLAYWTPEEGNLPARVSLITVPNKALVRTKNLFNVYTAALHWHPEGHMLCVRVQRYTKSKKSKFTNLEIFRTSEKDVPVDVIELKDCAVVFDWEPTSENFRFAILHMSDPTRPPMNASGMATVAVKTNISFYGLERKGKLVKKESFRLLKTIENKNTTALKWSPRGRHIVLATLRTIPSFELDFYDLDFDQSAAAKTGNPGDAITQVATNEHFGVTDLDWDPSGRFVITSASMWRHSMENGYILWDFKGQQLRSVPTEEFKQIFWRPRPRSLLTEEQKREVRKDLKSYTKEFEEQDERKLHAADAELMAHRRRLITEWENWRQQVEEFLAKETDEALAGGYKLPIAADTEDCVVDEIVEEIIDEKEEIIG